MLKFIVCLLLSTISLTATAQRPKPVYDTSFWYVAIYDTKLNKTDSLILVRISKIKVIRATTEKNKLGEVIKCASYNYNVFVKYLLPNGKALDMKRYKEVEVLQLPQTDKEMEPILQKMNDY